MWKALSGGLPGRDEVLPTGGGFMNGGGSQLHRHLLGYGAWRLNGSGETQTGNQVEIGTTIGSRPSRRRGLFAIDEYEDEIELNCPGRSRFAVYCG